MLSDRSTTTPWSGTPGPTSLAGRSRRRHPERRRSSDMLNGGEGLDTADYTAAGTHVQVDLAAG